MLPWIRIHAESIPAFIRSIIPDSPAFIAYAGFLFLLLYGITGMAALRSKAQSAMWAIFAVLLAARLENAVLHIVESAVLRQYTPGVITALLIVLPISLYLTMRMLKLELIRASWRTAVLAAGFVVQFAAIGGMLLLGSNL